MPRHRDPDPPLPDQFSVRDACAAGLTEGQIRHRLRSGAWVRVARGSYRRADWLPVDGDDPHALARAAYAQRVTAAVRANRGCAAGFESAAVLERLPLFSPLPGYVILVAPPGHWTGRRSGLVIRQSALSLADISLGDVPATSPVRTWFDIARTSPLRDGLAVGDGGLRSGAFGRNDVLAVLARAGTVRGCRNAALAAVHLDALRETPLESGSWAYFVEHRLPLPRMQVEIRDENGRLIGRVDFLWDDTRIVGECDGRLKYSTPDSVYTEKLREDEIRARGFGVVRWGWTDLRDGRLAARLRRQL